MNIYSYLKEDHRIVKALMDRVCDSANALERKALYATIREELTMHSVNEEVTFYQALLEKGSKQVQEMIKYSEIEHDDIEHFLRVLDITDPKSDKWLILFGQLQYCVDRHMEREESEIFEAAQKLLSESQALSLAAMMDELKQRKTILLNVA